MSRRLLEVLRECESGGVRLDVKASALSVRGGLTPGLRDELKRHKPNVLHYLRTGRCHHELQPEECKVCNGYVKKLIEEGASA